MATATDFWTGDHQYQDLVKTYYKGITYKYPDRVTSRGMCPCLKYWNSCPFPLEGKAEYIEYWGENI